VAFSRWQGGQPAASAGAPVGLCVFYVTPTSAAAGLKIARKI